MPFRLDGFCRMFNKKVQGGRLIASSSRLRLVYEPAEQKSIHPAEASDATAIKQQGQGEKVLKPPDCKGLVDSKKMYCMPCNSESDWL